ncbi:MULTISPECIES: hypothetical protein [unclassified Devosia]|jgi:hypothetical protein|uniref:hypothetical protein n=1 Tax=unclassified Devosia TaxID=196773 RepID=UPI001AC8CD71|nr:MULTISPECIES: hypothetical protein [unclassified Devosia]MBN9361636.1 hypothetical protein [Devosia sp.]
MQAPGIWGIFVVVVYAAVLVVPFWKIFPRAGWSKWASLLMLVPLLNIVLLWTLAFKRWPRDAASV